jgi:hypothetical protein
MNVNTHGLQRYGAADVRVQGLIDHAHGAAAYFADDLIAPNALRDGSAHGEPFCATAPIPAFIASREKSGGPHEDWLEAGSYRGAARQRVNITPALTHTRPSDTKLQQLWLPVNVLSHSVPIQKTPYAMA